MGVAWKRAAPTDVTDSCDEMGNSKSSKGEGGVPRLDLKTKDHSLAAQTVPWRKYQSAGKHLD